MTTTAYPQMAPQQTVVMQTTTTSGGMSGMRQAIPALPMVLAVILLVVNILFPGVGTVIAGFSVLCCGNVGESGASKFGTFCINFWVGILQLGLALFVVGWVWSIMWGVAFIAVSAGDEQKVTTTTTTIPGVQAMPPTTATYVQPIV